MKPEYSSQMFSLIFDDSVFCYGDHVKDILRHKFYDNLVIKVFFGVIRDELAEKTIHEARFQFICPDIFDDDSPDQTSQGLLEKSDYRAVELLDGLFCRSMRGFYSRFARFVIVPMKTMNHWHFLVWSRNQNTFTHYDSNYAAREAVNLGAARRTVVWMTRWLKTYLHTDLHVVPELIEWLPYPQEIHAKLDGSLYMLHGISCLIDYLHIEDGEFDPRNMSEVMDWKRSDMPKIRNSLFRRLTGRLKFSPWPLKL
ncbi:hypothetical protein ZOSMA_28G00520 [Zostera marina]|uniref:Ubiquitin-like protease family profile domain-containing protein n=1 Tax=Zostera marina TaxID=29655 RepID=A0A0K9PCJ9_ZOSMR|nr:hypothetical protein ZOSMA_28G00520 [Zostera marina]